MQMSLQSPEESKRKGTGLWVNPALKGVPRTGSDAGTPPALDSPASEPTPQAVSPLTARSAAAKLSFARLPPPPPAPLADGSAVVAAEDAKDSKDASKPSNDIPRAIWLAHAMRNHPDILELRECTRALSGAESFARLPSPGRTEMREALSHFNVTQLLMQYLEQTSLINTRKMLEEEAKVRYWMGCFPEKSLVTLLRIGVKDTKTIFDQNFGKPEESDRDMDTEVEVYDHGLQKLGEGSGEVEEDVNIYEEPDGHLVMDHSKVVAGSLNKLVEALTSETLRDLAFRETFLMTYQTFTTPELLLKKLVQRYNVSRKKFKDYKPDEFRKNIQFPVQIRVYNVIKYWVNERFSDFNEKLMSQLNNFIDGTLSRDGHAQLAKQLRNQISKQLSGAVDEDIPPPQPSRQPEPKVPKNIFSPSLQLFEVDEEEIARQMTLIDSTMFKAVQPAEFLAQGWNNPKMKHLSPNVMAMIARFVDIGFWVCHMILKEDKVKQRGVVLRKIIKIAEHLRNLNNFYGCMAIVAGLNMTPVYRLKFTQSELPRQAKDAFAELDKLFAPDNNNRNYRQAIENAKGGVVPYLGIHQAELTQIEEQNDNEIDGGLINFAKRKLLYEVISKMKEYQRASYELLPVHQVQVFLQRFDHPSEQELIDRSNKLEPKKAERDQIQ